MGGQSVLAPRLREAQGPKQGELLALQQEMFALDMVEHDGRAYPGVMFESMVVPEAYGHGPSTLPHQMLCALS